MSYRDDPVYQAVEQIRLPGQLERVLARIWNGWSGETPRVVRVALGYTNYKPFERARIVATVTLDWGEKDGPQAVHLFLHVHASEAQARQEAERGVVDEALPDAALPVFLIPRWCTVVWTVPNAPNLPGLEALLDPDHFCWLLVPPGHVAPGVRRYPVPELFRYVPLKRALLRWENPHNGQRYYAKLLDDAKAARVAHRFGQINQVVERENLPFTVPRLLFYTPMYRTLLMDEVPGRPFTETMRRLRPAGFAQLGQALGALHEASVPLEAVWTPRKELDKLHRQMAGLPRALPKLAAPFNAVVRRLEAASVGFSFPQDRPIHGNLFGDQVLYTEDGLGIVDWDDFSLGDPLYDVGRFVAHLVYVAGREGLPPSQVDACAEVFLSAYESRRGREVDRRRLNWHVTMQLLFRGKISSLRPLPPNWQDHLAFAVAEALRMADGQSRYACLAPLDEHITEPV